MENVKKKVVFKDAGKEKVAVGYVTFDNGFVKVVNDQGSTILINRDAIVFIRDGDY